MTAKKWQTGSEKPELWKWVVEAVQGVGARGAMVRQ